MGTLGSLIALLIPAISVAPAAVARLAGLALPWPGYVAGGIGLFLSISAIAGGGVIPGLKSLPLGARFSRFSGLVAASLAALLGVALGGNVLGFAAVGVAAVFSVSGGARRRNVFLEMLPCLVGVAYGFVLLVVFRPEDDAASQMWRAGGAAWMALLGGVAMLEVARSRLASQYVPLAASVGAAALAAFAGRYFNQVAVYGEFGLDSSTYAVGLAFNAVIWGAAALVGVVGPGKALAGALMGSAWHALGGWPYSTSFWLGAASMIVPRRLKRWKAFETTEEVIALLAPGVFLAGLAFFLEFYTGWRMAVASLAGLFAMRSMEAVTELWGTGAYRLFPPRPAQPGEPGSFTFFAVVSAIATVSIMALAPWVVDGINAGPGWAALTALSALEGMAIEALCAVPSRRMPTGLISAIVSPVVVLLASIAFKGLFPEGG